MNRRISTVTRRGLTHVLALVFYLVGSLLATWPLAAHLTTHVTGDAIDDPALAWNLWWIKARLVEQLNPDIFHVGWMFHPININLAFYTLTPLNGLISVPLQYAATLTLANNVVLLSSFVLGGYGVWLLTQAVWGGALHRVDPRVAWAIAWLAGAFYAFAGAKLFYAALGQFNIASSQWLPFAALYLWRTLHSRNHRSAWRNGALAGLFLVLQAWAELTYATFLLLFFALVFVYVSMRWLGATPRRLNRWALMAQSMFAAALVFAVGIAPFLAAMLPDMRAEGDFFASGGGFADLYSADLMGYLMPTRLHPWLGDWVAQMPFANDKAQHIYLGYTLMLLIIAGTMAGLRMSKERGKTLFWLVVIVFFWLLTLGPSLRWAGSDLAIPGPFALVSQLPFFSGNRYPSRYSVMLLLSASVLAARALLWLVDCLPWRGARFSNLAMLTLVALLFTMEHLSTPLPLNDFRVPPIYERLAQEPGDFALLELPTGWRNGARVLGKSDELIMMQQWYQTVHGKRRLGGNTSRNPAYKFQYFSETPLLADLIALMISDRNHLNAPLSADYLAIAERVRQRAPQLFNLLDIRYVTLHLEKSPPLLVQLVEDALPLTLLDEWRGMDWSGAPSTIRLYAVNPPEIVAPLHVNMADAEAQLYLAEGWSPRGTPGSGRLAQRSRVELLLPSAPRGAHITLLYAEPTTATYRYQGINLGQHSGSSHVLDLPSADNPTTRLTLEFTDAPTPIATLVPDAMPIGSTGVNLAPGHTLFAQSAGEEVGDFAHLWLNGVDYATGERGYHLLALTPAGEVLESATFDTMTPGESARMIAWLARWQAGVVIAGAGADSVADEAATALDENAIAALQQLGVKSDLRGKLRWSHAFVGVVGAPPGSALEAIDLTQPASVWVGAPVSAGEIYGTLKNITLEQR
jgi:hypothetical protein